MGIEIKSPASGGGGAAVEESQFTATATGASGGPHTFKLKKIGNLVVMEIPEFGGTAPGGVSIESNTAIAVALRPPTQWIHQAFLVMDNNVDKVGILSITPDGGIRFGNQQAGNLSAGPYYVNGCTITWTIG